LNFSAVNSYDIYVDICCKAMPIIAPQEPAIIASPNSSEAEYVSDIQALTFRVQTLGQSVDRWNTAMIWALVLTAIAAVAVLATTRIVITQAGKLGEAQRELAVAKEQQLAIDLKDKDIKIGELELARLDLEKQVAPRRLSRQDKRRMADLLKQGAPIGIVVASALLDPESSDFAEDLNSAIHRLAAIGKRCDSPTG
jgi:hypothetical protein